MRIALVAPDIPDYATEYARVLAESCDVLLQIPMKFRRSADSQWPSRLEIGWVSWPRQRSLANIFFIWKLAQRIRRWRPDVIHCLDGNNIWLSLLTALVKPIPFITTVHDIYVHPGDSDTEKVPRLFIRALVSRSAAIFVHGEGLKADAATTMRITEDRIFAFPHPPLRRYIEIAKKNGFKKPNDGLFRVLFFGRIYEYKGLRYLIEAAASVHEKVPQAKFIIAGRGEYYSECPALISDYFDVENRFIPDLDAARMFTEADLLVLPYIEASQSGVLMIALCFNLPVIATDIGEMASLVRQTDMGTIVPTRDSAALACAIIEMAEKAALRNKYQSAMNIALQRELSPGALSSRAREIYRLVLQSTLRPKNIRRL